MSSLAFVLPIFSTVLLGELGGASSYVVDGWGQPTTVLSGS